MKASELRIKNKVLLNSKSPWHEYYNKVVEVTGTQNKTDSLFPESTGTVDLVFIDNIGISHLFSQFDEFISPIPITEDLLVRCGFEGKNQPFIKYPFEFYIDDIGNCSCYYKGHCLSIFSFVHQLQNLYFAITGEELIINQPK